MKKPAATAVRTQPTQGLCLLVLAGLVLAGLTLLALACYAVGLLAIAALLYALVMLVSIVWLIYITRAREHARYSIDLKSNIVSVPGELFSERLILPKDVESVNILVGQLGVWQAAWLCLCVRGKSRFVVLAQTLRWAATRSELAGMHQQAGRKLAVRFGCPFRLYFNSGPDMNRNSVERYLRPIDLLKAEA